ncbi:MAG TPA: amidohydrolase family protein [Magnetospirillaceae bacterium]|nr:amidohydrolase family protein [Magnetospirillaceae bacterium]
MIDAHLHLWRVGQNGCSWPGPDLPAIYRDFTVEDAKKVTKAAGVEAVVLVQSQPCAADTDFLLKLAEGEKFIRAVVGWTDLLSPDAPARIAALARNKKLRGLRPMLQDLPDGWISSPGLDPAIEAMIEHDLAFDALVYTRHLPGLCRFAERHPALRLVIDHAAKPPIASGEKDAWRNAIAALADLPQVQCKLSGLLTEAGPRRDEAALAPYVEHLLVRFGASRLIWGSDWPVLTLAGDYAGWLTEARHLTGGTPGDIFGGNALRFYGCSERA